MPIRCRKMTRVLLMSPSSTDADVRRHAETFASLPDVSLTRYEAPPEDRLAYVLRGAAGIFRSRRTIDVVVTVGPAALAAAKIGWRGPIVHIVAGRLTRAEASLGRVVARRKDFRLVTSSAAVARMAMTHVADVHQVRLLRPAPARPAFDRAEVRRRLGVSVDAPLVQIVGTARHGSGHRLALWATSILAFRDPATRIALSAGGPRDAFVRRFGTSTAQVQSLVSDPSLTDADLAAAADVALCTADGPPEWSAIAAIQAQGVPIVALRSTWDRERLHGVPATLVDQPMARALARAMLLTLEGRAASEERVAKENPPTDAAAYAWSQLFQTLVPPQRAARHRSGSLASENVASAGDTHCLPVA